MQNIFSANETAPEVGPEFKQQQPATAPRAPGCTPHLPVHPPVPLRIGESMANAAGAQTDWKRNSVR